MIHDGMAERTDAAVFAIPRNDTMNGAVAKPTALQNIGTAMNFDIDRYFFKRLGVFFQ